MNIRYQAMAYAFITVTNCIDNGSETRAIFNRTHVHRQFQPSDPRVIREHLGRLTIK
jgi:hypothetical protein